MTRSLLWWGHHIWRLQELPQATSNTLIWDVNSPTPICPIAFRLDAKQATSPSWCKAGQRWFLQGCFCFGRDSHNITWMALPNPLSNPINAVGNHVPRIALTESRPPCLRKATLGIGHCLPPFAPRSTGWQEYCVTWLGWLCSVSLGRWIFGRTGWEAS